MIGLDPWNSLVPFSDTTGSLQTSILVHVRPPTKTAVVRRRGETVAGGKWLGINMSPEGVRVYEQGMEKLKPCEAQKNFSEEIDYVVYYM